MTLPVDLLRPYLSGSVCILGIGNRLSGDDAAGPALIDAIDGRVQARCFDGGMAPENFLEQVVRAEPDTLLIVDAVTMDAVPGEVRVLDPADAEGGGFTTHGLPLAMLCEYLQARRPMQIRLVGIQPALSGIGRAMSPAIEEAVRHLAATFVQLLPR